MRRFYRNAGIALLYLALLVSVVNCELNEDEFLYDDNDGVVEEVAEEEPLKPAEGGEETVYESPSYDPNLFYFADHFDDVEKSKKTWIRSEAKKDDIAEEIAKYDGEWSWEAPQRIVWKKDKGLVLKSKAKHAAIAARLRKTFDFRQNKPLVVQYEVQLQDGQECGGAYLKLLSHGKHLDNLNQFNDKTPYTIMFGPDKCGNDIKMHFIFRHVNPINGTITEKHCRKPKDRLEEPFKDKMPHLYRLVIRPDNTYEVSVDHEVINSGSLLTDFTPPVNPPAEIDDPDDEKPDDWDEREKIPDPAAFKPDDWDEDAPPQIPDPSAVKPDGWLDNEPDMIPDPSAVKPDDWDSEIDGEWEAPLVDNPLCEKADGCGPWSPPLIANKAYKGKWRAPLIQNPNYQGKWAPRKIPNPDFYEDSTPFQMTPIGAVGFELWSMSSDILFDNLIITDDPFEARRFAELSFDIKKNYIARESDSVFTKIVAFANDNPIAWKVALVLLVVPLAFSFYTIVSKSSKKASDPKKTDAAVPDDTEEIPPAENNDAENTEQPATNPPVSKPKKSDLDIKVEDDHSEKSDEDNEATAEVENQETESAPQKAAGARKRQLRKD